MSWGKDIFQLTTLCCIYSLCFRGRAEAIFSLIKSVIIFKTIKKFPSIVIFQSLSKNVVMVNFAGKLNYWLQFFLPFCSHSLPQNLAVWASSHGKCTSQPLTLGLDSQLDLQFRFVMPHVHLGRQAGTRPSHTTFSSL